jgi:hypothetical protein
MGGFEWIGRKVIIGMIPVGRRQKVSAIAALTLSPKTLRRNLYFQTLVDGTFDSARVAAFLRDPLQHLRGQVIVVWDNGRMHKGPAIHELLKRNPPLTLEWLPRYAPDLNPFEALWSHLKFGHCANPIPRDLDHLDNEATDFLVHTKVDPHFLHAHWGADTLG